MVSSSDTSNKNAATAGAGYGSIPVVTTTTVNVSTNEDGETPTRRSSSYSYAFSSFLIAVTALYVLLLSTKDHIRFSSSTTPSSSELELELIQVQQDNQDQDNQGVESFLLDEQYDATALYYDDQQVDHLHVDEGRVYSQRYYKLSKYWKGPGHPILVIMGGEAELTLPMLYPFVHDGLANEFGAFVISPEHRFYGKSQPVKSGYPTVQEMSDYLSPDQALEDAIQLITYIRNEIGCNPDKTNSNYCPIITVSYYLCIVVWFVVWCVVWRYSHSLSLSPSSILFTHSSFYFSLLVFSKSYIYSLVVVIQDFYQQCYDFVIRI
jgi:hypothetical protein